MQKLEVGTLLLLPLTDLSQSLEQYKTARLDQIKFLQRGYKHCWYHRPRLVWFPELPFRSAAGQRKPVLRRSANGNSNSGRRRAETQIAAVGGEA